VYKLSWDAKYTELHVETSTLLHLSRVETEQTAILGAVIRMASLVSACTYS
jgi:hypothetical protein